MFSSGVYTIVKRSFDHREVIGYGSAEARVVDSVETVAVPLRQPLDGGFAHPPILHTEHIDSGAVT